MGKLKCREYAAPHYTHTHIRPEVGINHPDRMKHTELKTWLVLEERGVREKSNWLVLPLPSRAKSASFIALLPSTSSMKFTAHNRGNRTSWPVPEDYTLAAYFPSSALGLNPIHSSKNWQWLVKITLAPLKTRKPEISVAEHINLSLLHVGKKMDVPDQLPALLWAVFQDPASIQFTALLLSICGFQGHPRGVHPASRWEKEEMKRVCLILDPLFLQVTRHFCSYFIGKAIGMATPRCEEGWERCSRFPATVLHYNRKDTSFWWKASSLYHSPLGTSGRNSFIWLVVICATEFCFYN